MRVQDGFASSLLQSWAPVFQTGTRLWGGGYVWSARIAVVQRPIRYPRSGRLPGTLENGGYLRDQLMCLGAGDVTSLRHRQQYKRALVAFCATNFGPAFSC
jgi:hypothetical protein